MEWVLRTINKSQVIIEELVNDCLKLYDLPLKELQQTARILTEEHFNNSVEFCSIISAKTGKCPEDCKYCAQSSHYHTESNNHDLISLDKVLKAANDAKTNGATRFCIVISGKGVTNIEEFNKILDMISAISDIKGLHCCCSLGIVSYEQALALKDAGVERFNHNVNTAKSYYKEICTTHTYEDRVLTANNLKKAGIELCCGGIIGMGETRRQRIEMALEIKTLEPVSVPLNILHPIAGTPMEHLSNPLSPDEILKTIAIYRIIMPDVLIRYAGGRALNLNSEEQLEGLNSGINALLVGNYLTTTGTTAKQDHELVKKAGKTIIKDT
jgi:biotin synthase